MSRSKKTKGKKQPKKNIKGLPDLKNEVLQILDFNLHKSFTVRNIAKALQSNSAETKKYVEKVLNELLNEGKIEKAARNSYISLKQPEYITGKIDHVNPRVAYLVAEEREVDIIIKAKDLKGAFHGDIVKVVTTKKNKDGREEGKVM